MANTKITNPELFNLGDSTSATQLPVMTTTQRIAMNAAPTLNVDYLVVAGGGGGGGNQSATGGGGGAGGLRTSYGSSSGGGSNAENSLTFNLLTSYTITVGDGGTLGSGTTAPTNGGNSSITGSDITNVTSLGGGAADNSTLLPPQTGGSGGGGGNGSYAGASGEPNQGYAGGNSQSGARGAGGGGAANVGANSTNNNGGAGGSGLSVNILSSANANVEGVGEVSGSSVYYAGGGGGGSAASGASSQAFGGIGGGGNGELSNGNNASAGTANTGGGGGGAFTDGAKNGGSGVVILRYVTADVTGYTTTGSTPIEVIENDYTVLVFKTVGTGTITFTSSTPTGTISTGEMIFNSTTDKVEYWDGTKWYRINYESEQPYQVDYLVVAGGGGAYYSGGGGGGYRTNVVGDLSGGNSTAEPAFTLVPQQVYTITVGGGGPGSYRTAAADLKGGDSTFDTITSIGGGKASNLWSYNGYPGGSGGGANVYANDYRSQSGGAGTAGQGYRGGNASNGGGDVTAGGGGAGGRGGDLYGSSGWSGTPGGAGLVSSIDGLSRTRSKGGDGGVSVPANPYGANTGAGGQGPNNSGLSGVVILRMPTVSYSGTTTGSPIVTEIGVNTILTYNSSGTYTA